MPEVSLTIPDSIVNALPDEDDGNAHLDMQRAVAGWEHQFNELLADSDETSEIVDLIERFEDRWEQYDDYVVELRAWGQSPIYAMAWRDLQAAMINQIYEHADLADRIDRERHARIVKDGIRRSG
jgi:hypothetical protein